jgi:hypothetical protein
MKTPRFVFADASDAQQRVPTALDPVGTICRSPGCPRQDRMYRPVFLVPTRLTNPALIRGRNKSNAPCLDI